MIGSVVKQNLGYKFIIKELWGAIEKRIGWEKWGIGLFGVCNGVANPVPCSGKSHKQQTADESNPDWNNIQNLLNLKHCLWVEAVHHILVP